MNVENLEFVLISPNRTNGVFMSYTGTPISGNSSKFYSLDVAQGAYNIIDYQFLQTIEEIIYISTERHNCCFSDGVSLYTIDASFQTDPKLVWTHGLHITLINYSKDENKLYYQADVIPGTTPNITQTVLLYMNQQDGPQSNHTVYTDYPIFQDNGLYSNILSIELNPPSEWQ